MTIDIDIQRAAEQAFGDKAGAAVAVDPRSGEVLCLLSRPAFDPNTFATRISRQKWNELLLDPRKPMHNRAIQSRFPPGSVFKIFMAVAGLQEGVLTSTHTEVCTGGTRIYGRRFACWKKGGHGRVDLHRAIVSSCNVFFYRLGRRLGIERIADNAKAMGLGYKTGIDLLGEDPGLILPRMEAADLQNGLVSRRDHLGGHRPGRRFPDTHSTGPSAGRTGPGRGLQRTACRSGRGAQSLGEAAACCLQVESPSRIRTIRLVSRGLWGVVNEYGTGRRAAVQGFDVCGKTGTAQVIGRELRARMKSQDEKFQDNAWFVGFAPRDFPEIAAAVFVEQGGSGGTTAAPVLQAMFQVYFDKHKKNQLHSEGRPEHIALSLPSGRAVSPTC